MLDFLGFAEDVRSNYFGLAAVQLTDLLPRSGLPRNGPVDVNADRRNIPSPPA
jgi:hypothetical protein